MHGITQGSGGRGGRYLRPLRRWQRRRLLADYQRFANVTVLPFQQLLNRPAGGHDHQGGPLWPDWERQSAARFNRDGKPFDLRPQAAPATAHFSGRNYLWAGPLHPHFGHGMAEFLTRLACSSRAFADPVLVFAARAPKPVHSLEQAPAWLRGVLDWYGVDPRQVLIVNQPSRFDQLRVFPQGEQLHAVGPTPAYLDLLEEIAAERLGPATASGAPLYVSRAGVVTGFAGEAYLESLLAQRGVRVFRPEEHSISEQMRAYRNHRRLIFPEGSALHGAQLLGRSLGDVAVLSRREVPPSGRFCQAFIQPRAKSLSYSDCTRGLIHGLNPLGRPALAAGIPLFDADKLRPWLAAMDLPVDALWQPAAFRDAERAALERWLQFNRRRPHSAASRALITENLARFGHPELAARAEQLLRV